MTMNDQGHRSGFTGHIFGRLGASFSTPITVAVLAIGVVLAACAGWLTQMRNDRIAEARFEEMSDRAVSAIWERFALYGKALRGVRGVIAAVGINEFTSEEFHRYFESRDIDTEYPGLRGYGFIGGSQRRMRRASSRRQERTVTWAFR